METSLHRELKRIYAGRAAREEVRLGSFRIDAVAGRRLVEVQHAPLASIRDKVRRLLAEYPDRRVCVVKPIVARKRIVRMAAAAGPVVSTRLSPKRQSLLAAFDELVHFTRVFPHERLSLELVLVEVEEWRYPGHGRRRWRRAGDYVVADQKLAGLLETRRLRTAGDLWRLLPPALPRQFDTAILASAADVPRWTAQRIAYCLRKMGAIAAIGKRGNTIEYRRVGRRAAA